MSLNSEDSDIYLYLDSVVILMQSQFSNLFLRTQITFLLCSYSVHYGIYQPNMVLNIINRTLELLTMCKFQENDQHLCCIDTHDCL